MATQTYTEKINTIQITPKKLCKGSKDEKKTGRAGFICQNFNYASLVIELNKRSLVLVVIIKDNNY